MPGRMDGKDNHPTLILLLFLASCKKHQKKNDDQQEQNKLRSKCHKHMEKSLGDPMAILYKFLECFEILTPNSYLHF